MFKHNFQNNLNKILKFNKKNFTNMSRYLKSASKNNVDIQSLEVVNLIKRQVFVFFINLIYDYF